jgi:hypothetical protein
VVEGDRVRIFVTNKLPEHTSVHWHGQRLPNGMDGVTGLTQKAIEPGKTFVYEFVARRPGTFMYHPHADEMTQMAMGMMGFWVTHPKDQAPADRGGRPRLRLPAQRLRHRSRRVHAEDHDDAGLQPVDVQQPGLPGHRLDERPARRQGAHPGGQPHDDEPPDAHPRPRVHGDRHRRRAHAQAARWPEVSADVAVGQMRQLEFVADEEGDWAFHCHKSHHTMNAMGHDVPTMIGVDHRDVVQEDQKLVPDYMVMGERGMADMGEMEMPIPDNTAPMMGGKGPFGGLEMGGMFTTVKVRRDQKPGDYKDPGWSHLRTHLQQTRLLTAPQVALYAELRGYTGATGTAAPDLHSNPSH